MASRWPREPGVRLRRQSPVGEVCNKLPAISLDTKSKLILSGLLAVVIASPVASALVYLTNSLSPLFILPVAWVALYLAADRIMTIIAGGIAGLLSAGSRILRIEQVDEEDEELEEETDYGSIEEKSFIVWALIKTLHDHITGERHGKKIYMAVVDGGIPIDVYPYPRDAREEEKLDSELELEVIGIESKMSLDGRRVIVFIPVAELSRLLEMAERAGNEGLVVASKEEANTLFRLVESLSSLYGGGSRGLTLYLAFKTLVQLRMKGLIDISDEHLDILAHSQGEVGRIVKRKVMEELGFLRRK